MMSALQLKPKWQISVVLTWEKTIIVFVAENCTTAELYDELKKHPLAPPVAGQPILISQEGDLEYSQTKHLSDYDIVNKGTLKLVVKLTGGLWPSIADLEERLRILEPTDKIRITTSKEHPDVFRLDSDTPRAIMDCGHAVAPLSLALHCYHELEKGEESIKCPDHDCGRRWKFSQIREAACLSDEESHEFERKALFNGMRKKQDKDCFVDEFFRILHNHPVAQQVSGYRVRFRGAELENSDTKRLSEYGINNRSFLALFIR